MSYTLHPLHNFLSYAHLFTQYLAFFFSVDSHLISKFASNVMSNSYWRASTEDEMHTLEQDETGKLVPLLARKKAVECQ